MSDDTSKFLTRILYLSYKATTEHYEHSFNFFEVMDNVLTGLFGAINHWHRGSSYIIAVPAACDFLEIDAAVTREFSKYSLLGGMRFRIHLQENWVVV